MYKLSKILFEIKILGSKFPKNQPWYYKVNSENELEKIYKTLKSLDYHFAYEPPDELNYTRLLYLFDEGYKIITNWYTDAKDFNNSNLFWVGKEEDIINKKDYLRLNEIKILGNITPDIIVDLYQEIWNSHIDPNGPMFRNGYKYDGKTSIDIWLKNLNQNQLKKIYLDLLKLKEKGKDDHVWLDDLDEMKLLGNNQIDIDNDILKKLSKIKDADNFEPLFDKYGWEEFYLNYKNYKNKGEYIINDFLKNLKEKNQLLNFYKEFIKLL